MLKYLLLYSIFVVLSYAQYKFSEHKIKQIIWCTKNIEEQYKCQNLTVAIQRDRLLFDEAYLNLTCLAGYSPLECIHHIDHERAHITTLDAGDMFISGRYNSLIPIMQEKIHGGFTEYHSVAVIKKNTLPNVHSLRDLRNTRACFPWVGSLAGWIVPIYKLQHEGGMDVVDCNNQVKTAANFFNDSCAVYSLTDRYNPIGDNSDKLCNLCTGKVPVGRCSDSDPYFGYDGAFRCLLQSGDIAFLRHSTLFDMLQSKEFKNISQDQFELLCLDGRRVPVSEYRQCSWGKVPTDPVVTSSARKFYERKRYQQFLKRVVELYSDTVSDQQQLTGTTRSYKGNYVADGQNNQYGVYKNNAEIPYQQSGARYRDENVDSNFRDVKEENYNNSSSHYELFRIFESKRFGRSNLLFQDDAQSLAIINEDEQQYNVYLQKAIHYIHGMGQCPVPSVSLCVTSDAEHEKCVKMKTALQAHLLKPDLICNKVHSHINCMQFIQSGSADIGVFDAGDVYTGGLYYDLIPFMAEVYNLDDPEYYVVAVAKEEDPDTELTYLKNKNTCHGGINSAAGWTYPMAFLISNGWIRPYACDALRAASEYFTKSCIPGAISNEYNFGGVPYSSMCELCHGASYRYCKRDASEEYYGHTGAFRCLVEGGGHVAFVKHTTVMENTGGKRKEWWARNALNDDFELLCTDGTRARLHEYKRCNLGKVRANAIVTRGGPNYNETQVTAFTNLLMYAQQLYGRKDVDSFSFSMFSSPVGYYDLIFQDATRQLHVIPPNLRRYDAYLGDHFMRARRITDCFAGAHHITHSLLNISISIILQRVFS